MTDQRKLGVVVGCIALSGLALCVCWTLLGGWSPAIDVIFPKKSGSNTQSNVIDFPGQVTNGNLTVHFINVDQGDGILLQGPDGTTAMIDGGWDNGLALAYLQAQGIQKIDIMIASHPHADHIGGLTQIMRAMPVGQVVTSGAIHTTTYFEDFIDTIADQRIPYVEVVAGDEIPFGELALDVIYGQRSALDLNDTSLVLKLVYGEISFLFTGDAGYPAEQMMLANARDRLPATILKVAHHGSYSSTRSDFLSAIQPQLAVYSAGRHNDYGHPHDSTIENLLRNLVTIYSTDVHGSVVVVTDGQSYTIVTESNVPPVTLDSPVIEAAATPSPAATWASTDLPYDPFGPDRDCGHFTTHEQAQQFFIAAGGPGRDPHRLDGDNDGIACESLP